MISQWVIRRYFSQLTHIESNLKSNTILTTDHLVPELKLNLITPLNEAWKEEHYHSREKNPQLFSSDPFWAIFWPGGQALCRYILDHPELIKNQRVLDLGCGCGAGVISSIKSGAKSVCGNDIDELALTATKINANDNQINQEKIHLSQENFLIDEQNSIEKIKSNYDLILVGDMFFDEHIGDKLMSLTHNLVKDYSKTVLVGDPGRWFLEDPLKRNSLNLSCLAKYELPINVRKENYGLNYGFVYRIN